jgi:hypothetical protein
LQKDTSPKIQSKKRQREAEAKRKIILKLNSKQLRDLKSSKTSETELWKKNLIANDWCNIGPKYKLDKFGLPTPQPGVPQPTWVHNRN